MNKHNSDEQITKRIQTHRQIMIKGSIFLKNRPFIIQEGFGKLILYMVLIQS